MVILILPFWSMTKEELKLSLKICLNIFRILQHKLQSKYFFKPVTNIALLYFYQVGNRVMQDTFEVSINIIILIDGYYILRSKSGFKIGHFELDSYSKWIRQKFFAKCYEWKVQNQLFFSLYFTNIMYLMKAPKNFEKIPILKIWQLVSF